AFTCGPAPIAKSISVAVAERETIAVGLWVMVTLPLAAYTVTGNCVAAALDVGVAGAEPGAGPPELAHAATDSAAIEATAPARARRVLLSMLILHRHRGGRSAPAATPGGVERTALPPRTGFAAQGRRPGSPPKEQYRCGTAPGSHRSSLRLCRPGTLPGRSHPSNGGRVPPPRAQLR